MPTQFKYFSSRENPLSRDLCTSPAACFRPPRRVGANSPLLSRPPRRPSVVMARGPPRTGGCAASGRSMKCLLLARPHRAGRYAMLRPLRQPRTLRCTSPTVTPGRRTERTAVARRRASRRGLLAPTQVRPLGRVAERPFRSTWLRCSFQSAAPNLHAPRPREGVSTSRRCGAGPSRRGRQRPFSWSDSSPEAWLARIPSPRTLSAMRVAISISRPPSTELRLPERSRVELLRAPTHLRPSDDRGDATRPLRGC